MGGRARDRWLVLVALSPLVLTVAAIGTFEWSDGGLILEAADRVLRGDAPYRDFHWHYLPGMPYLFAAVEVVAGRHYVAVRALFVAAVATSFVLDLALLRRIVGPRAAWVAPIVLLPFAVSAWRPLLNHQTFEPLAGVATALLLVGTPADARPRRLSIAGLPGAALILFNHLAGALVLFGALLGWIVAGWQGDGPRPSLRGVARDGLALAAPALVAVAMVLTVGAIRGGNRELVDWAVLRLMHRYVAANADTPLWSLGAQGAAAPHGLLGGAIAMLWRRARIVAFALAVRALPFVGLATVGAFLVRPSLRARLGAPTARALALCLGVGGALYLEAFKAYSQDRASMATLLLATCLWCTVAVAGSGRVRRVAIAAGAGLAAIALTFLVGTGAAMARDWRAMPLVPTRLGALRSTDLATARSLSRVVAAVEARGARTLFAYYLEPSFYPLTGLAPATSYDYMTTVLTGNPEFDQICETLARRPADLVLRGPDWDLYPNAKVVTDNHLERCIRELYVESERLPSPSAGHDYVLMVPRSR